MDWQKIREEFESSSITLKDLAEKHGIKLGTLKSRKSREGWSRGSPKKDATKTKKVATIQKDATPEEVFVEAEGLTDKQRLFCIYYIKSFNATKAYQKAYECAYSTAMVEGHRSLRNPKINYEIDRLKEEQSVDLKLGIRDILQKYIDIAFADITDFLQFGREEEVVYDEEGYPQLDANGNPKMRAYSYVHLNESTEVDGTIITEVKQGREGISVKLADKMKALEMLSKYFDLLSENDKKKLQEEKLKVDIAKGNAEIEKLNGSDDEGPIEIMISRKGGR